MKLPGFRHRMIAANGIDIHVVIGGEGSPLVLLHGFPQTWREFRHVMPELARRHTVVALDLRGAGHSACPQGGYDKVTMAADVHAAMLALGHERYAVCGHDIGAMVALALAAGQREAVTHLVVLDAPMPGWSRWQEICANPRVWHFAFHQKQNLPELLIRGREHEYVSSFIFDRVFDHGALADEDIDAYVKAFAQPGRTRGGLEWYRAFPLDDEHAQAWKAAPMEMPVLALGGEHRWGPDMVAMMREWAIDVEGGSIRDCGHWVPEEQPAALAEAMLAFLATGDAA
jgi:pimeloyl-ACP methyl ester carboxylesterase